MRNLALPARLLAAALLFLLPSLLPAQSHLAVPLEHPVYKVVETAELRGVLSRLSAAKPYTRAQLAEFLAAIEARMDLFSPAERAEIEAFAAEFGAGQGGAAAKAGTASALWRASNGKAAMGFDLRADARADLGGVANLLQGSSVDPSGLWHLASALKPYLKAYPEPWLSLWGSLGITYDKVNRSLFLPYSFSKEWDARHKKVSVLPSTDGEESYPTWSFDLQEDIAGATESGSVQYRLSRFRRDWGFGSGSLALSGTARPFVGLELQFRPSDIFALTQVIGSLGNWEKGSADQSSSSTGVTQQKMFAAQRLELFPFDWLSLAATTTMIGAKRLELGYFAPTLFMLEYQVMMSDVDNMGICGEIQVLLKRFGKLYASVYVDEMELSSVQAWFTQARNMFAYQGGAKLDLPWLPFATLTAQYTKLEPFVYTHPPTWNSDTRLQVNLAYTHDGENIGYHLKPNSDELLLRLDTRLAAGWRAALQYGFVRHGDNPNYVTTKHLIWGDMDEYVDYSSVYAYTKNFLHDGIYDYNHLGKLDFFWRPAGGLKFLGAAVPAEFGLGFGLSYTWYEDGTGGGATVPAPAWKEILELSAKINL